MIYYYNYGYILFCPGMLIIYRNKISNIAILDLSVRLIVNIILCKSYLKFY